MQIATGLYQDRSSSAESFGTSPVGYMCRQDQTLFSLSTFVKIMFPPISPLLLPKVKVLMIDDKHENNIMSLTESLSQNLWN